MSKAFDTLNHKQFIRKCEIYGLHGQASSILTSYLSNRKQFLYFNGETSNNLEVTCGVPQGFVLGPLFFSIYINDLSDLKNRGDLVVYADDTTIVGELKTNLIHDNLTAVKIWISQNKLTNNKSKTKVITFGLNWPSKLNWNEVKLEQPGYAKMLGVWLHKDFIYLQHLRVMKNKCIKFITLFYQTKG